MKSISFCLFLITLFTLLGQSLNGQILEVEKSHINFGKANGYKEIICVFNIKNSGAKKLVISRPPNLSNFKSGLSQTATTLVRVPKDSLPPGAVDIIEVIIMSNGYAGDFNYKFTVLSNSLYGPVSLSLEGTIEFFSSNSISYNSSSQVPGKTPFKGKISVFGDTIRGTRFVRMPGTDNRGRPLVKPGTGAVVGMEPSYVVHYYVSDDYGNRYLAIDQFGSYIKKSIQPLFEQCDSSLYYCKKADKKIGNHDKAIIPTICIVLGGAVSGTALSLSLPSRSPLPFVFGTVGGFITGFIYYAIKAGTNSSFRKGKKYLYKAVNYYNAHCATY